MLLLFCTTVYAQHIKVTGAGGSSGLVSDEAYDEGTWNGVTSIAPSKNSVRDKLSKSHVAKLINSDLNDDIRQIKKEVNQANRWMIERRKFFIKLTILVGMILALLIFSHLYLKVG